ncbi:MAG: hypothetical protein ACKVQW_08170 [Pyrinomonadaceae bacterium]
MQIDNTDVLDAAMPSKNLTIKIVGLALTCWDATTTQWKVFFPKAENHFLKLVIKKEIGGRLFTESVFNFPNESNRPGSEIELTPDSKNRQVIYDSQVEEILDLKKLHEEDIPLVADKTKYIGFLTLNGAVLRSEYDSLTNPSKFEVWETRPEVDPTTKTLVRSPTNEYTWTIATAFSTGFEISSTEKTTVDLKKVFGFDLTLDFNEPNVSYEITFSNDCEGEDCNEISDFKYYYNIIDVNALTQKRKFELIFSKGFSQRRRIAGCAGKTTTGIRFPAGS